MAIAQMTKKIVAIWLPFIVGLLLVTVAVIDLYQFKSNAIDVHTMLSREIPIVLLGLISSLAVFISSFYWLYKKNWAIAVQSFLSPILFLVCFVIGGAMGAAYINAT